MGVPKKQTRRRPRGHRTAPPVRTTKVFTPARTAIHHLLHGSRLRAKGGPTLQRNPDDRSDPRRFETMHERLFIASPTSTGAARRPWVPGTETQIKRDFKASMRQEMEQHPQGFIGQIAQRTTEQAAEADAIAIDARLHNEYPQIERQLSEAEIRQQVVVFPPDFEPSQAPSADFLENWIDNQLPRRTDIETFDLQPSDPDYRRIVTDLANDSARVPFGPLERGIRREFQDQERPSDEIEEFVRFTRRELRGKSWSWLSSRKASRTSALEGRGHVFISEAVDARRRRTLILHELVHVYAHPDYERWLATTTSPRVFGEAFTEHLARQAMTTSELRGRQSYRDSLRLLQGRILPFLSLDDVARAYFRGEVWRLEATSAVAQELFETQVGLEPGAPRDREVAQSATARGVVQEVEPGRHYRFMNLAVAGADPKTEHEDFLRTRILPRVDADPSLRLRFVGHASSTGPAGLNQRLSERRAAAFYRLARRLGIPRGQLLDAAHPTGRGGSEPTAGNTTVHGRAFNRRVELFLTNGTSP